MKWLTQRAIVDERVEGMQNRIFREMYYLILVICSGSALLKLYVYGLVFNRMVTELVILVVPLAYYAVRALWLGIVGDELELQERSAKVPIALRNLLIGLAAGLFTAVFFGVRSAILYGSEGLRLYYFTLVFTASLMIYLPFFIVVLLVPYLLAKGLSRKRGSLGDE